MIGSQSCLLTVAVQIIQIEIVNWVNEVTRTQATGTVIQIKVMLREKQTSKE